MDFLSYKDYVWPRNPHTYVEKASREPQYHTESGVSYFDGIGELKRTITGEGTFYGSDAYAQYQRLQELLESGASAVGNPVLLFYGTGADPGAEGERGGL